jgi:hypothetical protein
MGLVHPSIKAFRARVESDLSRYQDDVRTWEERVSCSLVTFEHARQQIEFSTRRVEQSKFLLSIIGKAPADSAEHTDLS